MTDVIIVAIISLTGTALGTFGGIVTGAKLTNYRLEQLEKRVHEHNDFAARIPLLELSVQRIEEELSSIRQHVGCKDKNP